MEEVTMRGRGRPPKYDWGRLLNGDRWSLKRGNDFDCDPGSLLALVRTTARKQGKTVKCNVTEDSVTIQAEGGAA